MAKREADKSLKDNTKIKVVTKNIYYTRKRSSTLVALCDEKMKSWITRN